MISDERGGYGYDYGKTRPGQAGKMVLPVGKILVYVCLILSLFMLGKGWLAVKDTLMKSQIRQAVFEAQNELNSSIMNLDDMMELQAELSGYGLSIDAQKLIRQTQELLKGVEDAAVAPSELPALTKDCYDLLKVTGAMGSGFGQYDSGMAGMQQNLETALTVIKILSVVSPILLIAVVALGILSLVMLFMNRKTGFVPFVILYSVIFALFLIGLLRYNTAVKDLSASGSYLLGDVMGMLNMVKIRLTPAAILGESTAIAGAVIWAYVCRTAEESRQPIPFIYERFIRKGRNRSSAAGRRTEGARRPGQVTARRLCPNCGRPVGPNSLHCSWCGTSLNGSAGEYGGSTGEYGGSAGGYGGSTGNYSSSADRAYVRNDMPAKISCRSCGKMINEGSAFCPYCGAGTGPVVRPGSAPAPQVKAKCPNCGADLIEGSKFCMMCGYDVSQAEQIDEPTKIIF